MDLATTYVWIFLAIAMASQKEPVDFLGISMIADGINHAVPTQKELQASVAWLVGEGLVLKQGNKYILTDKGMGEYEYASAGDMTLLGVWDVLAIRFKELT